MPAPDIKRVLAIGAHPDDVELLAGGTLALYAQAGAEVTVCSATNGSRGSREDDPENTARTRFHEAHAAAGVIGAASVVLNIADCELHESDRNTLDMLIDVIRESRPDVVIAHDPSDYHSDHRAASILTFRASFMASIAGVRTSLPSTEGILPVLYMDTLAGSGFQPEQYVDISNVFEIKRDMLLRHESQLENMMADSNLDFVDLMTTQSKLRGFQCGVQYAEAFRSAHDWLRERPYRLLP